MKILRPFFQFSCFIGALYVALTRIADNRHHPMDVVGMISHKKSQIKIFGHKQEIKNFIEKILYFS